MPQFCIIPSRALKDPAMTGTQLRALLAIGHFTSRDGTGAWAANATLAEVAGIDERDLRRSISELVKRGYLKKTPRKRTNGATMTSVLSIRYDVDELEELRAQGEVGEITPPPAPATDAEPSGGGGNSPSGGNGPREGRGNPPLQTSQSNELAAALPRERSPAVRLTAAANAAFDAKLGRDRNPITSGTAANLVEAVTQHAMPLEWAERAIYAAALAMEKAPRSMQYFTPGLVEQWEREQARAAAGAVGDLSGGAPRTPRPGAVTVGAQSLTRDDFWSLCVVHGLTARGQSREAIAERCARLHAERLVDDAPQFLSLVMHVRPWAIAEIQFERTRLERLAAALTSWQPDAAAA